MVQCTAPVSGAGVSMRLLSAARRAHYRLERLPPLHQPSRKAGQRLRMVEWHQQHGQNVSRTCRYFGISRPTFYRWQGRWEASGHRLRSLEDQPNQPRRRRQRTWTPEQVAVVRALREQHPRWGKEKLQRVLPAGVLLSVSMVGRILRHLQRTGQLIEPVRRISARKRRWARPYAVRKPRDYAVVAPGDLVQLDTMDVRPEPGVVLKHFTAHDVTSKWNVLDLHTRATASTATHALEALLARMPFPVKALQVDGGSEFMATFEATCQAKGIRLFQLPPRSPKLNGGVERANRTHAEEFFECSTAEPTVAELGAELRAWERVYNTVRPHQALGYQTPAQYLTSLGITHHLERSQV